MFDLSLYDLSNLRQRHLALTNAMTGDEPDLQAVKDIVRTIKKQGPGAQPYLREIIAAVEANDNTALLVAVHQFRAMNHQTPVIDVYGSWAFLDQLDNGRRLLSAMSPAVWRKKE